MVVFVEEHAELLHGNEKIAFIETVGDVPAERAKESAFLEKCVENAKCIAELAKGIRFVARVKITIVT